MRRVRALETSVTEATQAAKGTREELSVFRNQVVLTVDQLQKNNKVTQSMVDSWVSQVQKEQETGWQPKTIKMLHQNVRDISSKLQTVEEQLQLLKAKGEAQTFQSVFPRSAESPVAHPPQRTPLTHGEAPGGAEESQSQGKPSPAPSIPSLGMEEVTPPNEQPQLVFRLSGNQPTAIGGSAFSSTGPIPKALGIRPIEVAPGTPTTGFFQMDALSSELYKKTRKPTFSGNEEDWATF